MSDRKAEIIVAGAGLGGLTLALCLAREGLQVTVLEQARALGEVGAGVQISANGARVLHHLGLAERLAEIAFTPERGEIRHWQTGATLSTRPLGAGSLERFGFPYYHLHRADLHAVLAAALETAAPDAIRLARQVTGFTQSDDRVTVATVSGESYEADVLVGADGIHSTVRAGLFGPDEPRFTGCVAWRALIPTARLPAGHVRPVASNWIGKGGHFVHYYVRAGALVNCVGVVERGQWLAESWSTEGGREDFQADFRGWNGALQVLIETAERCFRWGLFDREPMPRWTRGRVTLLGDACHPMLPFMAQGAVMALEDAYTLARCLAVAGPAHRAALERYEALRRERTAQVQQMSRGNIAFFHNADADDLEKRLQRHRSTHLWLYGYDVTGLDFRHRASG